MEIGLTSLPHVRVPDSFAEQTELWHTNYAQTYQNIWVKYTSRQLKRWFILL